MNAGESRLRVIFGGRPVRTHRGARSFDRRTPAVAMLSHRRAWRIAAGHFEVISRDGQKRYRVLATPDGETSCTCTAGRFGGACWHQCAVLRRVAREGTAAWLPAGEAAR
jgi:hypothetical protein